jgi:hypothetical protein
MSTTDQILVRATVNLSGLRAGNRVLVDPSDDYIKACLAAGLVVPISGKDDRG